MESIARLIEQLKTDPIEYNRQTGRSTRMMEVAKAVAESGKAVVVVFKDEMSAANWCEKYQGVNGLSIIPMKVKMPELDWSKLKITAGPYAHHQTFLDHDVLYVYNKELFKAYHQYDKPLDHSPYVQPLGYSQQTA